MSLVTFYVKGDAPSAQEKNPDKRNMRRGKTFIVKEYYLIQDPRPSKTGSTYIRYLPGQTSIFVDKQTVPFDLDKLKSSTASPNSIKLIERRIRIDDKRNSLMLEYLRHVPCNVKNAEANSYLGTCIYEYEPAQQNKTSQDLFNQDTDLRLQIRGLDMLTLKAVYRILGSKTVRQIDELDTASMQHDLYHILTRAANKKEMEHTYNMLLKDPLLLIKYDIYEALDLGVLVRNAVDPKTFINGKTRIPIKTTPEGVNPIEWFAEWMHVKAPDQLVLIRGYLGRKPSETPETMKLPTSDGDKVEIILDHIFSEKNQITVKSGPHHMYESKAGEKFSLGGGRDKIKQKLYEDKELRYEIFEKVEALNELADA